VDGIPYEIDIVRSGNMDNFTLNILPKLNPSRPRHIETLLHAARLEDAIHLTYREETLTKQRIAFSMLNLGCLYGKLLAVGLPKMPFPEPSYSTNFEPLIQKLPGAPFIENGIGRAGTATLLTSVTFGALRLVGGELPPTMRKMMHQELFEELTDITDVSQTAYAKLQEILSGRPSLAIVKKLEDYMRANKDALNAAWQRECDQEHAAVDTYVQGHHLYQGVTTENQELRVENRNLRQQRDADREQLSRKTAGEAPVRPLTP